MNAPRSHFPVAAGRPFQVSRKNPESMDRDALIDEVLALRHAVSEILTELSPAEKFAEKIGFTGRQTRLFLALCARRGKIVERDFLMDAVYPIEADQPYTNKILDVFICQMREKLVNASIKGMGDMRIETIWGRGFRINGVVPPIDAMLPTPAAAE